MQSTSSETPQNDNDEFEQQCKELGHKIIQLLPTYPKGVVVHSLLGVIVSTANVFKIPEEVLHKMFNEAFKTLTMH